MTAILWADREYGLRRRGTALAVVVVLVAATLLLAPTASALVTTPGGVDAPRAPAITDTEPVAWTPPHDVQGDDPIAELPPAPATAATSAPVPAPPTVTAAPPAPSPAERLAAVLAGLPPIARASGAVVQIGDAPMAPGHWGVYEPNRNVVYVGNAAFANPDRLHYVVTHELAHAYYFQVATDATRQALDAATAGGPRVRGGATELVADCVALVWGARTWHYWSCPAPARTAIAAALPPA